MPVDVLAIAAHPDDIELTCAGTLLALKAKGRRFGIVDLTSGEMGTRGDAATREREARRAGRDPRRRLPRDARFRRRRPADRAREELVVIDVIRREKPRLVLTSYPEDRHPDHARAGRLVTDAAFYAGLRKLETAHPAHRPQQTIYFSTAILHEPTFVVDVTPLWPKRLEAILAFTSQFHDPKSKEPADDALAADRSSRRSRRRARHFGFSIGAEFGEGFVSMRPPRIDDLVACFEGFEAGF